MKRILFLFLALSILTLKGLSQSAINYISKSVGLFYFEDKSKPGYMSSGTGTLLLKFQSKDSIRVFLITNRHVLPTFQQNQFIHFKIKNDSLRPSGFVQTSIQLYENNGRLASNVRLDPDSNDLAVIDFTSYFIRHPEHDHILSNAMPYDLLASRDTISLREIELGSEVVFIGYPSFMYDNRNVSPIVRTGIIATSPEDDFYYSDEYRNAFFAKYKGLLPTKLSGFLIDATAVGGSSGSLVIMRPRFIKVSKDGVLQHSTSPMGEIYILGILTDSYLDLDSRLNGPQRVNLGGVISADQIIKTINLF